MPVLLVDEVMQLIWFAQVYPNDVSTIHLPAKRRFTPTSTVWKSAWPFSGLV